MVVILITVQNPELLSFKFNIYPTFKNQKPETLLNVDKVREDGVAIVKQFLSGGTVVVDHSLLWTTFIGQTDDFLHVSPYPKDIIRWSAEDVFGTVFQHMGMDMGNGGDGNDYNGSKVKRIGVYPGKKLSLQSHNKRSEHWVIVRGIASITKGSENFDLPSNHSTYISKKEIHRIENRVSLYFRLVSVKQNLPSKLKFIIVVSILFWSSQISPFEIGSSDFYS